MTGQDQCDDYINFEESYDDPLPFAAAGVAPSFGFSPQIMRYTGIMSNKQEMILSGQRENIIGRSKLMPCRSW